MTSSTVAYVNEKASSGSNFLEDGGRRRGYGVLKLPGSLRIIRAFYLIIHFTSHFLMRPRPASDAAAGAFSMGSSLLEDGEQELGRELSFLAKKL